jgi:hypothetical protein
MVHIKAEIEDFLERSGDETEEGEAGDFLILAKERAREILNQIDLFSRGSFSYFKEPVNYRQLQRCKRIKIYFSHSHA